MIQNKTIKSNERVYCEILNLKERERKRKKKNKKKNVNIYATCNDLEE